MEVQDYDTTTVQYTKRDLYKLVKECPSRRLEDKFKYMEERLVSNCNCPVNKVSEFKRNLRFFKSQFKQKWLTASNKENRFLRNNEEWLNGTIDVFTWVKQKVGRPSKEFASSSERTKRRKTKELRQQIPEEELLYATQMSLRAAGKKDASSILKELNKSPRRATTIRKIISSKVKTIKDVRLSTFKALQVLVNAGLSRNQYQIIRNASPSVYPCYKAIQKAKSMCYPSKDAFQVTETSAETKLQDLLDHTTSRLCEHLNEVLKNVDEKHLDCLQLISKWGCDGSQQVQYKQKFQNRSASDDSIFQSSFVPIQLIVNTDNNKQVIWQNPVPSSPRFCRPIRIRFIKETSDVTKEEFDYVNGQIQNLTRTQISFDNRILKVEHILLPTMVDAKVCNATTNTTSTMRCYICRATSKDFNKLEKCQEGDPETFRFGLSTLHAKIRLFESILHLSYKLPIRKWQARTKQNKCIVKENKKRIQNEFKDKLSLLVDIPKAGFGNTNDGNTARRFFSDPDTAARITGVDLNLIRRFKLILEVISSGLRVNTQKLHLYCRETAEMYVNIYGWYPMTPTVHKILIHAPTIIEHAILPIGQLSEEAAEARNKHFRKYRLDYSRKFSRIACNTDVLNRLLLTSDPLISSMQPKSRRSRLTFSKEAIEFFLPEEPFSNLENINPSSSSEHEDS